MNCKIPIMYLNPGGREKDNLVLIEVYDVIHKRNLGNYRGPVSNIINTNQIEIFLFNNLKSIIFCKIENHPTFISYLRSGINIGLTISYVL